MGKSFPIKSLKIPQKGIHLPSKEETEKILQSVPIKKVNSLIHIGRFETTQQTNGTLEGMLLSASHCPEAWEQIARLGGEPWWEIQKEKGLKLVNLLHAKNPRKKIDLWAKQNGYFEERTVWKVPCSTTEEGNPQYCICDTEKEAQDNHDPEVGQIRKTKALFPIKPLWAIWSQRQKHPEAPCTWRRQEALLGTLIEYSAQQGWETPDGIYWNEILDPYSLSAPRTGLSPTRLQSPTVTITKIQP